MKIIFLLFFRLFFLVTTQGLISCKTRHQGEWQAIGKSSQTTNRFSSLVNANLKLSAPLPYDPALSLIIIPVALLHQNTASLSLITVEEQLASELVNQVIEAVAKRRGAEDFLEERIAAERAFSLPESKAIATDHELPKQAPESPLTPSPAPLAPDKSTAPKIVEIPPRKAVEIVGNQSVVIADAGNGEKIQLLVTEKGETIKVSHPPAVEKTEADIFTAHSEVNKKRSFGTSIEQGRDKINLDELPSTIRYWPPASEITYGDLHGNSLKMLWQLIHEGAIKLQDPQDYKELADIYFDATWSSLSKAHFNKFEEILTRSTLGVSQGVKFRFIGDMLADRGANDALTLAILNTMKTHKIPYEIILSNHDVWFLIDFDVKTGLKDTKPYAYSAGDSAKSVRDFYHLLSREPDLRGKFTAIIRTAYLPHLKLLSYSSGQKGVSRLAVYSHAPISFSPGSRDNAPDFNDTLDLLLQFYQLPSKKSLSESEPTVEKLPAMIDALNAKFQSSLQSEEEWPSWRKIQDAESENPLFCFRQLIWQRPGEPQFEEFRQEHPEITFVHGHDITPSRLPTGANIDNVENIDNGFGKGGPRQAGDTYKIFTVSPPVVSP